MLQELRRRAHLQGALRGITSPALLLFLLLVAKGDLLDAFGNGVYCLLRWIHGIEQLGFRTGVVSSGVEVPAVGVQKGRVREVEYPAKT